MIDSATFPWGVEAGDPGFAPADMPEPDHLDSCDFDPMGPEPDNAPPADDTPMPEPDDELVRETFEPGPQTEPETAAKAANLLIEPVPLFRPLPSGAPFPVEAMGQALAGAVDAIADIIQCAPATAAGSVLAAASLAVQGLADVVLPIGDGMARPASLFLLTVAASGERKSSADGLALAPVRAFEEELAAAYRAELPSHMADVEAWKAAKAKALKGKADDWRATANAVKSLGAEPQPPMAPILTASEPTMQGLARLFATGRPALGLMNDEGGAMLGGWGFQAEHRMGTMAALNSLWDGSPLKRVRAGDGAEALHGRRLACHLMLQPNVAASLLGDPEAAGIGLLARFLVTAPAELAGTRMQRPNRPESRPRLAIYATQLAGLLRFPLPTKDGDPRHLVPRPLPLTAEAVAGWGDYADICERRGGQGGEWGDIRAFANKAAEHAARLAAVIALFHDPDVREIDGIMFERGRQLADFYGSEMLRLSGHAAVGADLMDAEALRRWIGEKGLSLVATSHVLRLGPSALRTAPKAKAALFRLTDYGWLAAVDGGAEIEGKRYRDVWRVLHAV